MTQVTEAEPATDTGNVETRDAVLQEAVPNHNPTGTAKLDLLLETAVEVQATLGTVRMPIGQLLRMGSGSVVPLDREVGQPVDLLLNGVPFAKGHLVVVHDRLAVRLVEVEVPDTDADEAAPAEDTPA